MAHIPTWRQILIYITLKKYAQTVPSLLYPEIREDTRRGFQESDKVKVLATEVPQDQARNLGSLPNTSQDAKQTDRAGGVGSKQRVGGCQMWYLEGWKGAGQRK